MTRINADLDPKRLADQHLMAEYQELAMVHASLRRSMRAKSVQKILSTIPPRYVLGKGHVTFFYDKLKFLDARYKQLIQELRARNYNLNPDRSFTYDGEFPAEFYNDWQALPDDRRLIAERLASRIMEKPTWYKYYGKTIPDDFVSKNYPELNA